MHPSRIDPNALPILGRTPAALSLLLDGLSAEGLSRQNPEGWSIKDIVAHLLDTEESAFLVRIRRMLDEDEPLIESIDPAARLAEAGYAPRSLGDLLAELVMVRADHVDWLADLTPAELARSGRHAAVGAITPATLIHQWAYHDLAHLRQILEMI